MTRRSGNNYSGARWTFAAGHRPTRRELRADPEPRCDLCGQPAECERGESCPVHAGDWNPETGNHLSCEGHDAP